MTRFKNSYKVPSQTFILPRKGTKKKRVYDQQERAALGLPPLEDDVQIEVVEECKYIKFGIGKVFDYLFHSPSGGSRNLSEGKRFKKMGTRKGFPDLFIFITNSIYHGLFIELKSGKNTVTDEQKAMHILLTEQGYKVVVCYGRQAAIDAIKDYLKIR